MMQPLDTRTRKKQKMKMKSAHNMNKVSKSANIKQGEVRRS
jgi:hypothetical protein